MELGKGLVVATCNRSPEREIIQKGKVSQEKAAKKTWQEDGLEGALPRLHDVSFRMRQRGVKSINLQPLYCALRPGVCDLTA